MMKKTALIFLLSFCLLLCACGKSNPEEVQKVQEAEKMEVAEETEVVEETEEQEVPPGKTAAPMPEGLERVGVRLEPKKVTPTGLTLSCTLYKGSPENLYTTQWFAIEEKEGNEWVGVEKKLEDTEVVWTSTPYIVGNQKEWEIEWEWLYGTLPKGSYRLVKELIDTSNTAKAEMDVCYIYFEV